MARQFADLHVQTPVIGKKTAACYLTRVVLHAMIWCILLLHAKNPAMCQPFAGSLQRDSVKPNVIIINVDDLGYGDLGYYGATKVRTPNIDKLAGQGRRLTDFHSASAVCTPSRYALITGTYPARTDLWSAIFLRNPLVVDPNQMTIGKVMQQAGYSTAAIGKWHLGFGNTTPVNWNHELRPGPLELGF